MLEIRRVSKEEFKITKLLRVCSQKNVLIAIEAGISLEKIMNCLIQYNDREFEKEIKGILDGSLEGIDPD